VNGVKLAAGASNDYTATNGTSISFTYTVLAGSVIDIQVFSLVSASALSQWTTSGNNIFYNTGNVGIGGTPTVSLDVGGRTDALRVPVGTTAQRPSSPTGGMIRYNTDLGGVEYYSASRAQWIGVELFQAAGGTVSTYTEDGITYKVHTFTSSGTFTVSTGTKNINYLIVAGGGGGGPIGGGGGAGGLLNGITTTGVGSYSIVIGGGGNNGNGSGPYATNGGNTTALGFTSIGGGGGGNHISGPSSTAGLSGGSGGGGADNGTSGGSGTAGQGNAGGTGIGGIPASQRIGGGGGGAGAVGASASVGGAGGNGIISAIDGNSFHYAGGGGAGGYQNSVGGNGGLGGGGGGSVDSGTSGTGGGSARNSGGNGVVGGSQRGGNGGANTGGGGGGCSWQNPTIIAQGGSGIVIIRYPI
jgi:hypothetical protein